MQLKNIYINRKGELATLSYEKKCDLSVLTCKPHPDCVGIPNIEHIWFSKQRIVRDLYNKVKDDQNLKELWIFGSSTQERCTVWSDLDVAYLYEGDASNFLSILSNADPNGVDCLNLKHVRPHSNLDVQIRKGWRII